MTPSDWFLPYITTYKYFMPSSFTISISQGHTKQISPNTSMTSILEIPTKGSSKKLLIMLSEMGTSFKKVEGDWKHPCKKLNFKTQIGPKPPLLFQTMLYLLWTHLRTRLNIPCGQNSQQMNLLAPKHFHAQFLQNSGDIVLKEQEWMWRTVTWKGSSVMELSFKLNSRAHISLGR